MLKKLINKKILLSAFVLKIILLVPVLLLFLGEKYPEQQILFSINESIIGISVFGIASLDGLLFLISLILIPTIIIYFHILNKEGKIFLINKNYNKIILFVLYYLVFNLIPGMFMFLWLSQPMF